LLRKVKMSEEKSNQPQLSPTSDLDTPTLRAFENWYEYLIRAQPQKSAAIQPTFRTQECASCVSPECDNTVLFTHYL
jgi:hypothetical protein